MLSSAIGHSRLGLSSTLLIVNRGKGKRVCRGEDESGVPFSSSKQYVRTAAVRLALSSVSSAADTYISYGFRCCTSTDGTSCGMHSGFNTILMYILNACDESTPKFAVFGI